MAAGLSLQNGNTLFNIPGWFDHLAQCSFADSQFKGFPGCGYQPV